MFDRCLTHGARGLRRWAVLILSSDGGEKRELLPAMDSASLVGWSPDGERLLFSKDGAAGSLMAVRIVGGKADGPPVAVRRLPGFRSLGMTTDGRLFFWSAPGQLERLHVSSFELSTRSVGPAVALSPSDVNYIDLISWSPDNKHLAFVGGTEWKDDGVWLLENFLPQAKSAAKAPKKEP